MSDTLTKEDAPDPAADAESLFGIARSLIEDFREFNRQIWGLAGHAQSESGLVKASFELRRGLTSIHIADDAMSLGEVKLAALVLEAANEAAEDLRRQVEDIFTIAYPPADDVVRMMCDIAATRRKLDDIEKSLAAIIKESAHTLEQIYLRFEVRESAWTN